MSLNGAPHHEGASVHAGSKHRLDNSGEDQDPKRQEFSAPDLDLEALVSQLNQHSEPVPGDGTPETGVHRQLTLEEQLEGALASLQGAQGPGMDASLGHDFLSGGDDPRDQDDNMDLSSLQPHDDHQKQQQPSIPAEEEAQPVRKSSDYLDLLNSQLETDISPSSGVRHSLLTIRNRLLPVLDSVSAQLLDMLSSNVQYQDVLNVVTQPDTEVGKAFATLVEIFEQTKTMFTIGGPFLPYKVTGSPEYEQNRSIMQRANMATFCLAAFGNIEVSFYDLNRWFMPVFIPSSGRLLKSQVTLLLDLKTQAYISALDVEDESSEQALEELFPSEETLTEQLLATHKDHLGLNGGEKDFVTRALKRRENIQDEKDQTKLAQRYQWVVFLRDLSEYVSKNHHVLLPLSEPVKSSPKSATDTSEPAPKPANVTSSPQSTNTKDTGTASTNTDDAGAEGVAESPAVAAKEPSAPAPDRPKRQMLGDEAKLRKAENDGKLTDESTLEIYEAAKSQGIEPSRGRSSNYTRRTWSKEEEEALLKGLDEVQGPYWSQILELYGPGGSLSEVLKDRTQVQLKDKARNLKMFFVRCGLPIPAVFQYVTGDYASRKQSGKRTSERRRGEPKANLKVDDRATSEAAPTTPSTGQTLPLSEAAELPTVEAPNMVNTQAPVPVNQANRASQTTELENQQLQAQTQGALDKALSMLKENDNEDSNLQHLIQSVGDYINNHS